MKYIRRLLSLVFGISLVAMGGILSSRLFAKQRLISLDMSGVSYEVLWVMVAVSSAVGCLIIWAALSRLGIAQTRFQLPTNGASVQICVTRQSVENTAKIACRSATQIVDCDPDVSLGEDGWDVVCSLKTAPGAALLDVGNSIDSALRQALMHTTGLPVANLEMRFDDKAPSTRRVA